MSAAQTPALPSVPLAPVVCPLCQHDQPIPLFSGPDRLQGVPGLFRICRCGNCGLLYQHPRPTPDALDMIYPAEYPPHQADAYQTTQQSIHPDMLKMAQFVGQQHPHARTLLDVGCGSGAFLRVVQQTYPNWQVVGTDPGAGAVAAARQHGLTVHHGMLEQLDLPRQQWDVVTLWHVLEHLSDPVGTLDYIRTQLLAPQGVLFLAVPMADSWDARLFGRDWVGWDLPRHFVIFTHASLQAMTAQSGFQPCAEEQFFTDYFATESLRWRLAATAMPYALRRISIAATYTRPFRLLIQPYIRLAHAYQRTTVLTGAFQRQ
ncbi:MAG: class I SAM-dependent methyltransferase [Chloroflexaceae bacterium]|nr:class I SAM-dependent methyltransferase [Chloroflexaceae bacterium]